MIDFDSDSHTYWQDGHRVPAVSDVLAAALPDPYAFVDERTLAVARDRGIAVDAALQQLLLVHGGEKKESLVVHRTPGEAVEVFQYLKSYIQWAQATGWRTLAVQPQVYDAELDIAGTADEVGILNGYVTVMDWKCMATCQERSKYQVAAYARAWSQQQPQWRATQGRVLLLQADGRMAKAVPVDLAVYGPQFCRLVMECRGNGGIPN